MKEIVFISNNLDKYKEIKKVFEKSFLDLLFLKNFDAYKEPKETGKTFIENAKIKSEFGFEKLNRPCFADDSGICIEALNGGPGVLSKRFLKSFKSNKECFNYILKKTKETNKYKAFFKTSICYTINKDYNIGFEGSVEGNISKKISGNGGFGFDPIFIPDGYSKTFGEMSLKEKNNISHRSLAINKLINFLIN